MRRRRTLSRIELARRVEVTPQAVSQWESGRRVPDYAMCQKLGSALGVKWSTIHETAWRAKKRRAEVEAQVADLRDRLRAVADEAREDDEVRALLADLAADEFDGVLKVEVGE